MDKYHYSIILLAHVCLILTIVSQLDANIIQFPVGRFNAALGKDTSQSSNTNSGKAVDGITNSNYRGGSCTHTSATSNTWWAVNLAAIYTVYSVTLTNRGDCCGNRLQNFKIYGSNTKYNPEAADRVLCYQQSGAIGRGATVQFNCTNAPIIVKYITVTKSGSNDDGDKRVLTLCEVQVEAECGVGTYGLKCAQSCNEHNCRDGTNCNHDDGHCPSGCKSGYMGNMCKIECPKKEYGYPCEPCSINCLGGLCEKKTDTGYCMNSECEPGFVYGKLCNSTCDDGSFGSNCSMPCSSTCATGPVCDAVNGSCSNGCVSGYTGDLCSEVCENGTYGDRCRLNCSSSCQDPVCDKFSDIGKCFQPGCNAGYHGDNCSEECINAYGENCNSPCSGNCRFNDTCSRLNGSCPNGCNTGYLGDTCHTECEDYTHGNDCIYNCSSQCVNPCDKTSMAGLCGGICTDGYKGDNCTDVCSEADDCYISLALAGTGGSSSAGSIAGAATAVILVTLLVAVILAAVFFKRRRSKKEQKADDGQEGCAYSNGVNYKDIEEPVDLTQIKPVLSMKPAIKSKPVKQHSTANEDSKQASIKKPVMSVKPFCKPEECKVQQPEEDVGIYANVGPHAEAIPSSTTLIRTSEFSRYWTDVKQVDGMLKAEYENIPVETTSCDIADGAELKMKNRYKNILPYDNNLVALKQIGEDPLSTYINASFIKDYQGNKAYIAALGTTKHTLDDFWRMIWEYDIDLIVMLTNLVELETIKCVQYWPDDGSVNYEDISVTIESCLKYRTHTIRRLNVKKDDVSRQIIHYHYTTWPDKSVPESVSSLIHVRNIMKEHRSQNKEQPILVHCSAGVGRTGTVIALDILLEQAEHENQVDIRMCVTQLREQRTKMVQTLVQYVFLHDALHEILNVGFTTVSVQNLNTLHENQDIMKKQYEYLDIVKPTFTNETLEFGMLENRDKNRDISVIPADDVRVKIFSTPEDYINAVYVEGYHSPKQYTATQIPLENTANDFWKMIFEEECGVIVCLDTDKYYHKWYSKEKATVTFNKLNVTTTEVKNTGNITQYEIILRNSVESEYANVQSSDPNEKEISLKLFTINISPWNNVNLYEDLITQVAKYQPKDGRSTVMCSNGCTETGIYIALSTLSDMIQIEQKVDVFTVVKLMRKTRPQFIPTLEQYIFVHQALREMFDYSSTEYEDVYLAKKMTNFKELL